MNREIDEAIDAERRLLDPEVRADRLVVERMLAPDFTEIGASGIRWSRDEMLDAIGGFESSVERVPATRFNGRTVATGLVLVSYETPGAHRTSLWRRVEEGWQVVFHQATPVKSG